MNRAAVRALMACAGCDFPTGGIDEVTWQGKRFCSPECVREAINARDFAEDDEETQAPSAADKETP